MQITQPYSLVTPWSAPWPWPIVGIDILQETLVEACRRTNSKAVVIHPAYIALAVGLSQLRSAAPTGRCWNCRQRHEDLCEPSISRLSEWQEEWGEEQRCPHWETRDGLNDD